MYSHVYVPPRSNLISLLLHDIINEQSISFEEKISNPGIFVVFFLREILLDCTEEFDSNLSRRIAYRRQWQVASFFHHHRH